MDKDVLYSIKMRSSNKNEHISGAEKIVNRTDISDYAEALISRGLNHAKGEADFLNLKIEKVKDNNLVFLEALNVTTVEVKDHIEGINQIRLFLKEIEVNHIEEIIGLLKNTYAMRGAMLLDVDTLQRLEPDFDRGIRATNMDKERLNGTNLSDAKNHYEEAIVLATKVANCPGIIGEICISDDPDYVTGYVSSKDIGYRRITKMKEMGSPNGGRIFLYRGSKENVKDTIAFLENTYVIVKNVKSKEEITGKKNISLSKWDDIKTELSNLKEKNLYRTMRTIESEQASHIIYKGKKVCLMASNSYLDITSHPYMKEMVKNTIDKYGFGRSISEVS